MASSSGTTTERLSLGVNFQQLLFDDRLDIRAFAEGLAHVRQVHARRCALQCRADGADAAGERRDDDRPATTIGRATRCSRRTIRSRFSTLATDQGTTYRSVGSLQTAYHLPFVDGLRANVNLNYDLTRTDRQTFSPSTLHSQRKTGNGGSDYRANQSQMNTGLEMYLELHGAARPASPALRWT